MEFFAMNFDHQNPLHISITVTVLVLCSILVTWLTVNRYKHYQKTQKRVAKIKIRKAKIKERVAKIHTYKGDVENYRGAISSIKAEIEQIEKVVGSEAELGREVLTKKKKKLLKINYQSFSGQQILNDASAQERSSLATVLKVKSDCSQKLFSELRYNGSNDIAVLWREKRGKDPYVSYDEVVTDVAKELKVSTENLRTLYAKEVAIIETFTNNMLGKLSPEEREKFIKGMEAEAQKYGQSYTSVITSSGGIVLAQASGFGIYLAATTAVGAVTGILGITLPFVVYTTMTKVIATVIGPVGWAALGTWMLAKIGSPNMKKTIPGVIIVAAMRAKLQYEKEARLELIDNALKLIELKDDLVTYETKLKQAEVRLSEVLNRNISRVAA